MTSPRLLGPAVVLAILAGLAAWGCGPQQAAVPAGTEPPLPPWFEDVTDAWALDFVHDAGPADKFFMPEALGSGAALFDFDGDDRLDLYLLQNAGPQSGSKNRLFHQRGDGRFEDVSAGSGLDFAGYNMAVAIGDVNNDGRPDVLVTQYTGVRLFLNEGSGKFRDVTEKSGVHNPAWGASAAFFDHDRDGWLDLVLVSYVDYDPTWHCTNMSGAPEYCAPKTFAGRVSRLFHNRGAATPPGSVRFEDVTVASGLGRTPGPGLGVLCCDFDGDGWPDIFIANDGAPNHLWINQHNGKFVEEAVRRSVAYNAMGKAEAGMGVALGDVNRDGLFDLFVTHLTEETNTLWLQGPRGFFRDQTVAQGLAAPRWRGTGFGTVLADFDHDGSLDIAIVNGRVSRGTSNANPALTKHFGWYAERNQLLARDAQGRFRDLSPHNPALCGTPNVGRGLACGDIDGDGAIDLVVTTVADRARIFRNVVPGRGHWLLLRVVEPAHKRDACGAEVRIVAGGRTWLRLVNPADSYLCSSDPRVHVGLGSADRTEHIEVTWPDGTKETFPGGPVDRVLTLTRGDGSQAPRPESGEEAR